MIHRITPVECFGRRLGSHGGACYPQLAPSFAPSPDTLGEGTPCPTMNLSVRDAASLLKVSEKTIYRWIHQQVVPAYRVQEQYRFNRAELWSGRPHGG